MATFEALIEERSGLSIGGTDTDIISADNAGIYMAEGYKDIVNKVAASSPDLLNGFMKNITSGWSNNKIELENHYVLSVFRKGDTAPANVFRECRAIQPSKKHSISDPGSIYAATEMDPVYFIEDKYLTVIPDHSVNNGEFEYLGVLSPSSISVSGTYPTLSDKVGTHSTTDTTGSAGANYIFTLDAGHGIVVGDTVEISGMTQLTALNGLTTQVASVSTNAITLEGVISTGTQETSATGTFYVHGPNMPEDFAVYLILYTAIKLIEIKLSKMNDGLSTMIDEDDAPVAPTLAGDGSPKGGWETVRYYIHDEEDPELAGAKLQELTAEQQQWTLEYQWYQDKLKRLRSEYMEPFASAAASEGA